MNDPLTLGEYVRRLRRAKRLQLQQVADETGLSASHLSRIENDNAVPNAETVVKLAAALDGDLSAMLLQAECLPREILDRYVRDAAGSGSALRRSAGDRLDTGYAEALVRDMDATLRRTLAQTFDVPEHDAEAMVGMLQALARLPADRRNTIVEFLASTALEAGRANA